MCFLCVCDVYCVVDEWYEVCVDGGDDVVEFVCDFEWYCGELMNCLVNCLFDVLISVVLCYFVLC